VRKTNKKKKKKKKMKKKKKKKEEQTSNGIIPSPNAEILEISSPQSPPR
jgi:hypothetical protein